MNRLAQDINRTPSWGYVRIVLSGLLLAGLWWMLTEGDAGSWVVGVPAIVAALVVRRTFPSPPPFDLSSERWV